jgi:hypothetical protein
MGKHRRAADVLRPPTSFLPSTRLVQIHNHIIVKRESSLARRKLHQRQDLIPLYLFACIDKLES